MAKKKIWHVGAWAGNFGDIVIQESIKLHLFQGIKDYSVKVDYFNCQKTKFTKELIDRMNAEADLMIFGGGGLIFYRPQNNSLSGWEWDIDKDLIDHIEIPFVIYGLGYNQFEYDRSNFIPVTNEHLKKTVEKAALFSLRNHGSKRDLISRGCNGNKIEVIPDSGMFLPSKHITIPNLSKGKLKIAFTWTSDREEQTFPSPFKENRDKFIKACIYLLNYAIAEKNAQIFFIGHMDKEFDGFIIQQLVDNLIERPLVIYEELPSIYPPSVENTQYLADVYKQMDIVLGGRGHSNIIPFGQNVPVIGMGSHRKIRYFLEDIGRSEYFFDVRPSKDLYSIDKMTSTLNAIIDNMLSQRKSIKEEKEKQKILFDKFNSKILCLMN